MVRRIFKMELVKQATCGACAKACTFRVKVPFARGGIARGLHGGKAPRLQIKAATERAAARTFAFQVVCYECGAPISFQAGLQDAERDVDHAVNVEEDDDAE